MTAAVRSGARSLDFDPVTHTYRVDGRIVPGVTSVISLGDDSLRYVDAQTLAYKAAFGSAVHVACELDDKGDLVEESVVEPVMLRLMQWRKFLADTEAQILLNEAPVYSPLHDVAGMLDRVLIFNGASWLIDIKTGVQSRRHALQTAGYAALLRQWGGPRVNRRAALYLEDDKYTLVPHSSRRDEAVFAAMALSYKWINQC